MALRITPMEGVMTEKFKVFVAGTSGAGKTAFLASMYNRMSAELHELGFYLDTSPNGANFLIKEYQELVNPDKPWPPGTVDVTEWDFSCRNFARQQGLFDFSYLDFPGGFITDSDGLQQAEEFNISQKVQDANSLLFLIDGQKVHYFMEGIEPPVGHSLLIDIDFLVSLAMRANIDVPIHFVLTKWDILDGVFTLESIKEKLLSIPKLKALIGTRRRAELPTRLIPVSAFGKGFATLDKSGRMVKNKTNNIPSPFQVELSIACTLIDGFRVAHRLMDRKKAEHNASGIAFFAFFLKSFTLIFRVVGFGTRNLNSALPGPYQLGSSACSVLLKSVTRRLELKSEEIEAEMIDVRRSLENEESALNTAIRNCDLLSLSLERDYPASNLTNL
jgi:hypothetical protein